MTLSKLELTVDSEGYTVQLSDNVLRTVLEGGAGRYRLDLLGSPNIVSVQWNVDAASFKYLMAFFRTTIKFGSLPFLIDLVIDDAEVTEYTAHIIPGSLSLKGHSGLNYLVGCQLEVNATTPDESADETIVSEFTE